MFSYCYINYEFCLIQEISKKYFNCNELVRMSNADRVEDEDEGKPEPATAFWTFYGRDTSIGNGVPNSQRPDDICRRMDDSMSGPSAGILSCLSDEDGEQAALYALRAGMTCGWHIRGERGDAAVRVGKAKVYSKQAPDGSGPTKEARLLTLDAERWALCDGASFAAGNSVFSVEEVNEREQKLTIHCSKGPLRNKSIEIPARRCPFVFGRAHEADLCIMDRELSRKHGCILYVRPQGRKSGVFVLADLESTVSYCCIILLLLLELPSSSLWGAICGAGYYPRIQFF